jgi:hypothetical protein
MLHYTFTFFPTITVSTNQRRLLQRFDSVGSIDFFHNTTTIFATGSDPFYKYINISTVQTVLEFSNNLWGGGGG